MPRVIAIDWGAKRVGLAITDELQLIASPLTTVDTKDIWTYLQTYFSKENVETVIIGEPKQMNGLPSESTEIIEKFITQFHTEFPNMKMERVDERFTSKMASFFISQSGKNKKQRQQKGLIDKVSATIILQNFLEQRTR